MIKTGIEAAPSSSHIGWWSTFVVGLGLVCSMTSGCGAGSQREEYSAVLRFVDSSPQEIFDIRSIATETEVFDLSPSPDLEAGGWELRGVAKPKGLKDGRLVVRMTKNGDVVFTRELAQAAAEVDIIELEIGGLLPSDSVQLMWAEEGQEFKKQRSVRLGARRGVGATYRVFRFNVGDHAYWSGATRRIRIWITGGGQNIRLGRVVGIRLKLEEDRLREALAGVWLVELYGHHRAALLGMPGRPIEGRIQVPSGAELRFGVGLPPTQRTPVRFRVTVTPEGVDGEPATVFDHVIGVDEGSGWVDHAVDLTAFAGRTVRLALEVATDEALDPLLGLPMWANPVVWAPSTAERPPNVVLISLDTLRADHMSLYGYDRPTTPRITSWARRRAVVFETVVAPSPWTLPSHVSIMTGIDALGHGVNHAAPAPASLLTLAEMLRSRGYATVAVTGGSYLHPRFGLGQGFEDYRSFKGDLIVEFQTGLDRTLSWLDVHAERQPFFLFFHTYEVHDPYDPREPYYSKFAGGPFDPKYRDVVTLNAGKRRPDRLRTTNRFVLRGAEDNSETPVNWENVGVVSDLYDSGIAFADERLNLLLERLSAHDLRDNTLVILTSDHGEAMGEHQLAGHSSLYDHDLLVPLVIALPGGKRHGIRVATQVRLVDIAATVLDVVGMPQPPGIDGRSLVPLMTGEETEPREASSYAALSNHGLALRTGDRLKYIFRNIPWEIPIGWEELYDLDADPGENHNLGGDSSRLEVLRSAARKTLVARQSGMRIALVNHSDRECQVELQGTGIVIGPSTVKTARLGGGCSVVGFGTVGCDLAPGTEIVLIGERVESPRVEVSGTFAADAASAHTAFALSYEVGVDTQPQSVVFDVGRQALSNGPAGDGDVSLILSWVGDPGILGLDPAETDVELQQQLEALGYIQ